MSAKQITAFREPIPGKEAPLKQHILLLENEVVSLQKRLEAAHRKIAQLENRDPQQAIDGLLEDLRKAEKARIAKELENIEASKQATSSQPDSESKRAPKTGHGPREQQALDTMIEVYELADESRKCPLCEGEIVPLGEQFEDSEDIHVIERRYFRRQLRRRKYRCSCNACVITTPGPHRLIAGGRYSLEFTEQVAADKYLDNIPLERQVRRMARIGLEVTSQTLYDQLDALVGVLMPTYERLGQKVLEAKVLHADETRWPRLDGKGLCNWTVWTRTTPDIAHFAILDSRSTSAAWQLFRNYHGTIVVDGYQVYESLAAESKSLDIANCWAHCLRKFRDLEEIFPAASAQILALIGKLYEVEQEVEGPFPGNAEAQALRLALRQERSQPILKDIKQWAETGVGLPRSDLGKAVRYMLKRWRALTRFLDDPQIPLDNNAAERSLRGLVIGRKVHYGSKSRRGTEVAAVLYTLFETAKLCGVNPERYLHAATLVALSAPGATLLPHEYRDQISLGQ